MQNLSESWAEIIKDLIDELFFSQTKEQQEKELKKAINAEVGEVEEQKSS